jgi:catechol-2,3-dioxygenase
MAFAYRTLDELLCAYVRLKGLGIAPVWAADHEAETALYHADPDHNTVELNVNNYGDDWTATKQMRTSRPANVFVDPDKRLEARKAGVSPWDGHQRAIARKLARDKPDDLRAAF